MYLILVQDGKDNLGLDILSNSEYQNYNTNPGNRRDFFIFVTQKNIYGFTQHRS